jgi:hypothetical protein
MVAMRAVIVTLLATLGVAIGCTSAGTYPTHGRQLAAGASFSAVSVEIDNSLPAERLGTFRQFRGTHVLQDAIVEALERQGRFDPNAEHQLEVRVVAFRLKSGWDGILNSGVVDVVAGGYISDQEDFLTVYVSVLSEGDTQLKTGASSYSNRGGIVFFSEDGRLDNLSHALARALTDEI